MYELIEDPYTICGETHVVDTCTLILRMDGWILQMSRFIGRTHTHTHTDESADCRARDPKQCGGWNWEKDTLS